MSDAKWPALESDPIIFTNYFHEIGTPEDVKFIEMISLDYKEFLQIGGPVLGLILNFTAYDWKKYDKSKERPTEYVKFYMKQTHALDYACGLLAGLHTLGNAENIEFKEGSFLKKYYKDCEGKSKEERAKLLQEDKTCQSAHKNYANEGQTNLEETEDVGHYIAFIYKNGEIIELDGMKEGPLVIKDGIKQEDFIEETAKEIIRRINDKEIYEQINVMLLTDKNSNVVDLLSG